MTPRKRKGRKLLVASIGVAAVSYVACGGEDTSDQKPKTDASSDVVANLVAPPDGDDVITNDVVANLVAPPDTGADQQADQAADQTADKLDLDVVANLVAPPDASSD
jgi:hypothetical protein